jgi:hypothetical protein
MGRMALSQIKTAEYEEEPFLCFSFETGFLQGKDRIEDAQYDV